MREKGIPKEHQLICSGCGKLLDMRDISVLCHGWIEGDNIICYDDSDMPSNSSIELGKPIQWTKDKEPIFLN